MTATIYERDQFATLVGREETVECRMFDQDTVRLFEVATGIGDVARDRTDRDSFPGAIVPGFYTLSLVDALIGKAMKPTPDEYFINYGVEGVRFVAPIFFDDAAQFRFRVEQTHEHKRGLHIIFSFQFLTDDMTGTLMVGSWLVLLTRP